MKCLILRAFEYSLDGHNLISAVVGDTPDIPDSQVPGLFKEGFVGEPRAAAEPTAPAPVVHKPVPEPTHAEKMLPPLENKAASKTDSEKK